MNKNLENQLVKAYARHMLAELRIKEGGPTPDLLEEVEVAQGAIDTLKELLAGLGDRTKTDSQLKAAATQMILAKTGRGPNELINILEHKTPKTASRTKSGVTARIPHNKAPTVTGSKWERCKADFPFFCVTVLEIMWRAGLNPDHPLGGYGSFEPNQHQIRFVAVLIDQWLKGTPVRIILLKARQLGMTTVILAFWVWMMIQKDHFVAFFMIDKDPHMYEKRDMIIHWLETLEKLFPEEDIPTITAKGGKRIVLSNGSKMLFESAHSPNPGTSEMVHAIHLSEKPKWPKGRAALVDKSLLPGMPSAPGTFVVDESTAQGMGDFYKKWDRVMKGKEQGFTRTTPIFLPWYLSPEYSADVPADAFDSDGKFIYLNEDDEVCETNEINEISLTEEAYQELYGLTLEQLFWRRITIKNSYKGAREDFDQEYPTTPEHAWANFGSLFFGSKTAAECVKKTLDPIIIGTLLDKNGNNDPSRLYSWTHYKPIVKPDRTGYLKIYERPIKDMEYFIGGDVAEGKQVETHSGMDPDFSVLIVTDANGKVVAVHRSRVKPEELALPAILLGILYNKATINIERNSVGEATWAMFKQSGYNRIYVRDGNGPYVDRAWNKTQKSNRHTMLVELRHHLRRHPSHAVDEQLAHEISVFINNPKDGKPEAMPGEHDDMVLAYMHAWHVVYDKTGIRIEIQEEEPVKLPETEFSNVLDYNGVTLENDMGSFDPDEYTLRDYFFN